MSELRTYKAKIVLGSLPEGGATDWWTEEDWEKHKQNVKRLEAEGRLGEEEEISITLKHFPAFDDCRVPIQTTSAKFIILDLSKTD